MKVLIRFPKMGNELHGCAIYRLRVNPLLVLVVLCDFPFKLTRGPSIPHNNNINNTVKQNNFSDTHVLATVYTGHKLGIGSLPGPLQPPIQCLHATPVPLFPLAYVKTNKQTSNQQ